MMNYYGPYGWNGWMLMAMWIWPLAIAAAVWALVALTRNRDTRAHMKRQGESPSDILKRRFAHGEISQQEYLDSAAVLDDDRSRVTRA